MGRDQGGPWIELEGRGMGGNGASRRFAAVVEMATQTRRVVGKGRSCEAAFLGGVSS